MTRKITICAVMLSIATVLSQITLFRLPAGGGVTAGSMVPVMMISFLFGTKWGIFSALVYALIQGVTGFYAPPVQNFISFLIVILFDYVIAFGVLGLSGGLWKILGRKKWAVPLCSAMAVFLRFLCHLVSGIFIWSAYAPEGQSPFLYSLIYNGSYMFPEILISALVSGILWKSLYKRR